MKEYIKQINNAKDRNQLMGIIIRYSQDEKLTWEEFMVCHRTAEAKMGKIAKKAK